MKFSERLEEYRLRHGHHGSPGRAPFGAFDMPGPCGERLTIIADNGKIDDPRIAGWEHVSVSTRRRIPNWIEMCFVKNLFWPPEDCVVQFHPPHSSYVNNAAHVLHLWRWLGGDFPMPPHILVGDKDRGPIKSLAEALEINRKLEGQLDQLNVVDLK